VISNYSLHSNLFVQSQASSRTMWPSNNPLYRIGSWWIMPVFDPSNITCVLLWLRCGLPSTPVVITFLPGSPWLPWARNEAVY
jgi:hypothetical protein